MSGYWPSFFFTSSRGQVHLFFLLMYSYSAHITQSISSHFDLLGLIRKGFRCGKDRRFSCGIQQALLSGHQIEQTFPAGQPVTAQDFVHLCCSQIVQLQYLTLVFSFLAVHWKSQYQNTGNATPKPSQTYAVLSAIQQSPSNQPSPLSAQNQSKSADATPASRGTSHRPKERMHHNIPHRYDTSKNEVDAAMNRSCYVKLNKVYPGVEVSVRLFEVFLNS